MASFEKYYGSGVKMLLMHNERSANSYSNKDIDQTLSCQNISLGPKREMPAYDYYKQRLGELYVYRRKDVVTLCEVVCTLPEELSRDEEMQKAFFELTYEYLAERFGGEGGRNIVSCWIHYDEGKRAAKRDRFNHKIRLDAQGEPIMEKVVGRPHMHFDWIPAVPIDFVHEAEKKRHNPRIENYKERVCAHEVLTRQVYRSFHDDWQTWLTEHGIRCRVKTGITEKNGGNLKVSQLKGYFEEQEREIERLREIERQYNRIIERIPEAARLVEMERKQERERSRF